MHPISLKKIILITAGDPDGIGPEVILKALGKVHTGFPVVILGSRKSFSTHPFKEIRSFSEVSGNDPLFFEVDIKNGDPSFRYVEEAVSFIQKGEAGAIVTAPISKEKWIKSGHLYPGHTDFLVKISKTKKWAMFFWSGKTKVALYTTHIPLRKVFKEINKNKIMDFCKFVNSELIRLTGKKFNILVSGLNPHAGENGMIGTEEIEEIYPAVKELQNIMKVEGPFPPDTIFIESAKKRDSVIISLYHDQGLIPFKLRNINRGVNVTLGLPFVRTSPDHGTAYDIAGKGIADPGSMIEAIKLAGSFLKKQN